VHASRQGVSVRACAIARNRPSGRTLIQQNELILSVSREETSAQRETRASRQAREAPDEECLLGAPEEDSSQTGDHPRSGLSP